MFSQRDTYSFGAICVDIEQLVKELCLKFWKTMLIKLMYFDNIYTTLWLKIILLTKGYLLIGAIRVDILQLTCNM